MKAGLEPAYASGGARAGVCAGAGVRGRGRGRACACACAFSGVPGMTPPGTPDMKAVLGSPEIGIGSNASSRELLIYRV